MEEHDRSRPVPSKPVLPGASTEWTAAGATLPVLLGLIAWRRRQRRRSLIDDR
jgi:hypothetical protein